MNETKIKCPKCQKEDMFDVGYSRRAEELPHRHSVISQKAANHFWLWFGCDRCGIYVVEFNIKGLLDKFKEIRCEQCKKLEEAFEDCIELELQKLEDLQKAFMRSIAKARRPQPAPFFYEKSIKMIKQLAEENKQLRLLILKML